MIFAMSIPGLAVLLFALAAGERVWRWVRRRRGHPVVAQAGMDQFTTLFYGGKQLELDQRQTESMMRDEEEDGAPPRGPIDLDSGAVRLTPRAARPE
ncbi:DUF6191 domain-containing protein [Saccharothrix obliqua]|uniref:DUF6191 domain-containing protein n=1 Tax=Saccharothrix obliqua TaxID=2861747 RepID=UPI002150E249|nr:DUF6191 domain-containing protein [Saccharothrix obliqua]